MHPAGFLVAVPPAQKEFDALADFTFNLGVGNDLASLQAGKGLASTTLLRVLNLGNAITTGRKPQSSSRFLQRRALWNDKLGDLFAPRQALSLVFLTDLVKQVTERCKEREQGIVVQTCLALALDRYADKCASVVVWNIPGEKVQHVFGRQALPTVRRGPGAAKKKGA